MFTKTSPTSAEFSPRSGNVPETVAANLLDDVIGARGIREPVKAMLDRAYRDLSKKNSKWTRRRVRAIWDREASRIEYREIAEMQAVINARKQHAEYRAETARMAAVHLDRPASGVGSVGPHDCGRVGGMDRAGDPPRDAGRAAEPHGQGRSPVTLPASAATRTD